MRVCVITNELWVGSRVSSTVLLLRREIGYELAYAFDFRAKMENWKFRNWKIDKGRLPCQFTLIGDMLVLEYYM